MRPDLDLCRGQPIYPLTGSKTTSVPLLNLPGLPIALNYSTRKVLANDSTTYLGRGLVLMPPAGAGPLWSLNIEREFYIGNPAQIYLGNDKWELLNGDGSSLTPGQSLGSDLLVGHPNSPTWYAFDKHKSTAYTFQTYDAPYAASIATLAGIADIAGGSYSVKHSTPFVPNSWRPVPQLTQLTDAFGRITTFTYEQPADITQVARLTAVVTPDNQTISLAYNDQGLLASITWPDKTSRSFLYEVPGEPWLLTGIVDENSHRDRTFQYDGQGRAISTEFAGSADQYKVQGWQTPPAPSVKRWYDPVADVIWRETTWSNPQQVDIQGPTGSVSQINTTLVNGVARLTSQSQPAGSGCAASTSSQDYDANGNVAWSEDFNGHRTCFANDLSRNVETARVEGLTSGTACDAVTIAGAALSAGSRKISTRWHPVWRKAAQVAEPRRFTINVYNGQPDPTNGGAVASCAPSAGSLPDGSPIVVLCKQVEKATTDANGSQGFSAAVDTSVPARVRQWTYNQYGQVLTATDPLGNVTTYAYYADTTADHTKGDLNTVTNAKSQVTTYTKYNPAGQWVEMKDANGVVTTRTFDLRQRLKTVTVATSTTSYDYWPTGLLKQVTLPDASTITYGYDDAHRLTSVTDNLGNNITYTLDNSGNRTGENVKDPSGKLAKTLTRVPDALNRIQQITGRE